jgi:hypothetical protein
MRTLAMTPETAPPRSAKGQTSKNRHDLDTERNDPPVLPAVCSPGGKVQPALRAFNGLENTAQANDTQE